MGLFGFRSKKTSEGDTPVADEAVPDIGEAVQRLPKRSVFDVFMKRDA